MRAARALLGWSALHLAEQSSVGVSTIRRTEVDDGPVKMIPATMKAIIGALETAGVQFITENGGGAGVRLAKPAGKQDAAA